MLRKISGKSGTNKLIHLKSPNGKINTSKKEVSNVLGENFQQNSSSSNYSETFQNIKQEKEKEKLDFSSLNQEKYNLPFNLNELLEALRKSHDTAAGHYQILKHLPNKSLEPLLKNLNDI